MAIKARKREAARAKNDRIKNKTINPETPSTEVQEKEKLSYASKVIYSKYFLRFFVAKDSAQFTDSIIIFHTSEHHIITDADRPRLKHFIKNLPAKNVTMVEVRQVETGELREDQHVIVSREKKIRRFLRRQNVGGTIAFQHL